MEKTDWIRKLSSRKFWVAVCALVTQLILAFGGTEQQATQVAGIIMAGATVIAYIIAEGLADAAGASATVVIQPEAEKPPADENTQATD